MFIVGALLGVGLGLAINWLRYVLRRGGFVDVVFHSLLQVLTPFIIFFIAEEMFHASGVIAVVAAGIIHALVKERTENFRAQEQVLTDNLWSIIAFVLNGLIFLLLGLTLPSAMRSLLENEQMSNWLLLGYVLALGFVVLGIRFLWSHTINYFDYYILKNVAEKPSENKSNYEFGWCPWNDYNGRCVIDPIFHINERFIPRAFTYYLFGGRRYSIDTYYGNNIPAYPK